MIVYNLFGKIGLKIVISILHIWNEEDLLILHYRMIFNVLEK